MFGKLRASKRRGPDRVARRDPKKVDGQRERYGLVPNIDKPAHLGYAI